MQTKLHRWAVADPGHRFDDLEAFAQAGRVEPMTEADVWRDLQGVA